MKNTFAILCLTLLTLMGCSHSRQVQRKSNLMSFLYGEGGMTPRAADSEVKLQLPLRIGVAFIPPDAGHHGRYAPAILPPDGEKKLVDIVRRSFQGKDWVKEIVTIPSSYLMPRGGFENLSQVSQLMDVDVIALASVDQLQHSDPRRASFLYLSIIGAYILPLDKNETRTLIDTAVFHVPSRTFLLRAPGVNKITGNAALVDVNESLRERSMKSFELAMSDLSKNLDAEVRDFKTSVASGERANVDIVTAKGASVKGGGSFSAWEAAGALGLLFLALLIRRV